MSTIRKLDAAEALTKAATQLIVYQPFFGSLVMRLTRVSVPWVPTLGTDGRHVFYNPAYVESLTLDEQIAALAHEAMHCAMQHFLRRGDRDEVRMNIGGDMAVNPLLRDAGLKVRPDWVYPKTFDLPEGECAEWYADRLPKKVGCSGCGGEDGGKGEGEGEGGGKCGAGVDEECQGAEGGSGGSGSGQRCTEAHKHGGCSGVFPLPSVDADGNPIPGSVASPAERQQAASDWRIATNQAAQMAKAAGKLPAGLERFVEELRAPSVDWRDVLRRFVSAVVRDDYRMFPPNRRFISSGLYMPSMRSDSIGEIVIVVDSSGSIGGDEFTSFASEANAILSEVRPSSVHVLYHATRVHGHDEFTPDEYPIAFKTDESGGTNFQCVPDYIDAEGIDPVCVVWFTDMYPDFWPPAAPDYPVLWAATTDIEAPWGETIRIKVQ